MDPTLALSYRGSASKLPANLLAVPRAFAALRLHAAEALLERPSRHAELRAQWLDDEGDWISVAGEGDMSELLRAADQAAKAGECLNVRLEGPSDLLARPDAGAAPPAPAPAAARAYPDVTRGARALDSAAAAAKAASGDSPIVPGEWATSITVYVNATPITVDNPDPKMLLVDFLRDVLSLKGTKIGCGEAGCGACTVVLSFKDTTTGKVISNPVNSCVRPLASCDGMAVTTIEGLGSSSAGLHPLQKRLADCNGTQCGYCSPGWVMSFFGFLQSHPDATEEEIEDHFDGNLCRCTGYRPILEAFKSFAPGASPPTIPPIPPSAGPTPPPSRPEGCCGGGGAGGCACAEAAGSAGGADESKGDDGNESDDSGCCSDDDCECGGKGRIKPKTVKGYSAVELRAMAAKIEADLRAKCSGGAAGGAGGCCGGGGSGGCCRDKASGGRPARKLAYRVGAVDPSKGPVPVFPPALDAYPLRALHFTDSVSGAEWWRPVTLPQLLQVTASYQGVAPGTVKLIGGNTTIGVVKYYSSMLQDHKVLIDVSRVPELRMRRSSTSGVRVGAAVTLTELLQLLQSLDPRGAADTSDNDLATSSYQAICRHLRQVANDQVRNVATWAGNVILAAAHHDFPADVTLLLMAFGATVTLVKGFTVMHDVPVLEVVETLANKGGDDIVLLSMFLPANFGRDPKVTGASNWAAVDSFKVAKRQRNAHAVVNAAFLLQVSTSSPTAVPVVSSASVVYGGVGAQIFVATRTMAALEGQSMDETTLQAAITALQADIKAVGVNPEPSVPSAYRISLAISYLYKLFLRAQPAGTVAAPYASGALRYQRPVTDGTVAFTPVPKTSPVGMPVNKLSAYKQTAGEAEYVSDVRMPTGGLYGAYAYTTQATGTLVSLNLATAEAMPGVVRILTSTDIPDGGSNDVGLMPAVFGASTTEYLFIPPGADVQCIGQPVALVLADSLPRAQLAAKTVTATYGPPTATGPAAPITTIAEAIAAKSTFPNIKNGPSHTPGFTVGDLSGGFAAADFIVSGSVDTPGQRHFYMETQCSYAEPIEGDAIRVATAAQGLDFAQASVQKVTGLPLSRIVVENRRMGGAFGGKIARGLHVAGAAAVAARVTGRPVQVWLDREEDTNVIGGREPVYATYKAGVKKDGTLTAVQITLYTDAGCIIETSFGDTDMALLWMDNCYNCGVWDLSTNVMHTTLPSNTAMRAPGVVQSVFVMETVMSHLASASGLTPEAIRAANFYKVADKTPYSQTIHQVTIATLWQQLQDNVGYSAMRADCAAFNKANRWRKRGAAIIPVKYGLGVAGTVGQALITVYPDGTIQAVTGGTEMGQGLNVKVAQTISYALGAPLEVIDIAGPTTQTVSAASCTGGSTTSELCCATAKQACDILNQRLEATRKANPKAAWADIVAAASMNGVNMTVSVQNNPAGDGYGAFDYYTYGAAVAKVEADILTGETVILSSDILMDLGNSLNPQVDVGQIEGAYAMGIGYFMTETVGYTDEGACEAQGTWNYKPPSAFDIPLTASISLLKDSPNPAPSAFLSSKASGEPPYALSMAVWWAIKDAVSAARSDAGTTGWWQLAVPASPAQIVGSSLTESSMFKLHSTDSDDASGAGGAGAASA